ncbi:MAG: metal ABC transporter permease, partial [Pseudomonadales bacterium]|nr:metal ABC transporter permease [Pseudomonadales bacterium]
MMITVSVQWVAVYLVFSCLIIPALATIKLSIGLGLGLGLMLVMVLGCLAFASGLLLSSVSDLPAGALIV